MKFYQAFDIDETTPVQFAAVHVIRWRPEWGEPAILFREVDDETQTLADAAPDFWAASKLARKALDHDVPEDCWATGPLTGDVIADLVVCPGCVAIAAIDAAIAKATTDTGD